VGLGVWSEVDSEALTGLEHLPAIVVDDCSIDDSSRCWNLAQIFPDKLFAKYCSWRARIQVLEAHVHDGKGTKKYSNSNKLCK